MYRNREGISGIQDGSYEYAYTPTKAGKKTFLYVDYIGHTFCGPEYCLLRASYSHFLLMYLFNGQAVVETEGMSYVVNKNQAFLINTSKPHIYGCMEEMECLWCHFDGTGAEALFDYIIKSNHNKHVFTFNEGSEFLNKLGTLLYSFTRGEKNNYLAEITVSARLHEILGLLLTESRIKKFSPIDEATHYIQNYYATNITLSTLSKVAGLSISRFSALFKAETGYSPYQYVLSTRLHIACQLLANSEFTVEEISAKIGFSSPTLFITAFKQKYGTTPNKYRCLRSYTHTVNMIPAGKP